MAKRLGAALLIIGILSFLLPLAGTQFLFLSWINRWGTDTGLFIRLGMVIVGAVLYFSDRLRNG